MPWFRRTRAAPVAPYANPDTVICQVSLSALTDAVRVLDGLAAAWKPSTRPRPPQTSEPKPCSP